jgi:hypothetical protein
MIQCDGIRYQLHDGTEALSVQLQATSHHTGITYRLVLAHKNQYMPQLVPATRIASLLNDIRRQAEAASITGRNVQAVLFNTHEVAPSGNCRHAVSIILPEQHSLDFVLNEACFILVRDTEDRREIRPWYFDSAEEAEAHAAELVDCITGGKFNWEKAQLRAAPNTDDNCSTHKNSPG